MQVVEQVVEAWIEAKVIRADGTVEDVGVLDHYKRPEAEEES